ncbi:2-dehydro-3-deoxy-6-phosphogalactonate aldolase [Halotalea alkalilenta]|uniref:2-dehydro-3-deoxy-6-phosphogalactonate aldolase n=1 Tax=Halotalea alkalilenta TaxID=376489 RepID=A0A172YAM6_9GAMM|nr:2-dehydro-3-deoxy-6-phosphogalactonate aldolase [Halotalea alkalilenta]ANF56288.1 2-dehydro-3-deoxy-6-phosphogalactonate aldolase [Halotalea alkalilenta]
MDLSAFDTALVQCPLVAILRGITPAEIDPALDALVEAGFKLIEVPLNSPDPFISIERLAARAPADVAVGAGTVLDSADVHRLADIGASLLVTPNVDLEVLKASRERGLGSLIGCLTPSEAFTALKAGARAVKLFPAARFGTGYLKDIKSVLPKQARVMAVGGVRLDNMAEWHAAGIQGFGFGSNLYTPGTDAATLGQRARALVAQWQRLERA